MITKDKVEELVRTQFSALFANDTAYGPWTLEIEESDSYEQVRLLNPHSDKVDLAFWIYRFGSLDGQMAFLDQLNFLQSDLNEEVQHEVLDHRMSK